VDPLSTQRLQKVQKVQKNFEIHLRGWSSSFMN